MADQPAKPMDLTDLPLPSQYNTRSTVLTEAQDAATSTSAPPFAEPPTIAAPKSKAQKQREYRQRMAASRTAAQAIAARKSDAERQRNSRLRKANLAFVSGSSDSTTTSSSSSGARSHDVETGTQRLLTHQRQNSPAGPSQITQPGTSSDQIDVQQAQSTWNTKWASSIMRFKSTFLDNDFGYACSVCDRLWFKNDLKPINAEQLEVISEWFIKENRRLCTEEYEMVCNTCKRTLNKKSMPPLAKVNGFSYPEQPPGLPPLDPISERLISPHLPFMQVRRLRHDFSYGIIGQVINVPVDVQEMVKCLPRKLNEDDVINVNIKRNLAHKSVYINEYMSKSTISAWLTVLQKSPLYRLYEINVDLSRLHHTVPFLDDIQDDPSNRIDNISAENTPESEILASREHTMMWNEEDYLNIAPGHQATPLNIVYDRHTEELSFPSIYFGEPRRFNMGISLTPYMIATSEIRRRDRRGATPQKILYVAMKLLRLRMVNGVYSTFRNVSVKENVTRRMLEDPEFLKEYVIQNLAFMKTVPNSVQYWASRKRDLFAIIRQLGKPTAFLTISANEIRWIKLLTILLKLSKKYPGKSAKDLNTSERCTLVSDDPVTCCIYFYKLVGSLMKMLKSKQTYNPFGKYFVKDYFLHIEFQHRGSPHAHILLWLNDDPREAVSENMPRTIDLVEKLSSVARHDVPNNYIYANQIHKHTFTCTKRGETICRFGIPYWPMPTTRVLVPIPQSDGHRQTLQQKAKELRTSLGERRYASMDEFLNANGLTYVSYLDVVRSTLRRPTLVFRRNLDELMTNTFNPYLAGEVNSNIDIQFILDEYSCADYVVEYVNKSARGMSNLRRELTTMMQEHPDQDYTGQLKALSTKLLNAVEMSAQEAAWYLLRQPMSETSRQVVYIPTVWPTERQCCRKRRQQMDREGIDGDSTDVWTRNIIQRYEERPASLEQVYLAEFASWYANANEFVDEEDDVHVDDDEDSETVSEARTSRAPKEYRRRLLARVIRYRRYDIDETDNYKREMVLLYVQFRNEMSEIIDQNKFLQLFDNNKDTIMVRHSLSETNFNIENVMKELEAMMIMQNDDNSNLQEKESRAALVQRQNKREREKKNMNMLVEKSSALNSDKSLDGNQLQEKNKMISKTDAQRSKEYRERQKAKNKKIKIIPKTDAQRSKEYRERQKAKKILLREENGLQSKSTKTPAEYMKEYRRKKRLNNQITQLNTLPTESCPMANGHHLSGTEKFGSHIEFQSSQLTYQQRNNTQHLHSNTTSMSSITIKEEQVTVKEEIANEDKEKCNDLIPTPNMFISIDSNTINVSPLTIKKELVDVKEDTANENINICSNTTNFYPVTIKEEQVTVQEETVNEDIWSNTISISPVTIKEEQVAVKEETANDGIERNKDLTATPNMFKNIYSNTISISPLTIKEELVAVEEEPANEDINICSNTTNISAVTIKEEPVAFIEVEVNEVIADKALKLEIHEENINDSNNTETITNDIDVNTSSTYSCFLCDVCNKKLSTKNLMVKHLKVHIQFHSKKKLYSCNKCDMAYNQISNLTKHMRVHTTKKRYSCSQCDKTFADRSYLRIHKQIHSEEKPYNSNRRDEACSEMNSSTNHMQVDTEEKPYSCSRCGKGFIYKSYLTSHMRVHTKEKPYCCDRCDAAYSQIGNLKRHMRVHTGEKPYSCSRCDMAFGHKTYLTRHMRAHTGEKPYSCNRCDKAFSQINSLTRHMRVHTVEKSDSAA